MNNCENLDAIKNYNAKHLGKEPPPSVIHKPRRLRHHCAPTLPAAAMSVEAKLLPFYPENLPWWSTDRKQIAKTPLKVSTLNSKLKVNEETWNLMNVAAAFYLWRRF